MRCPPTPAQQRGLDPARPAVLAAASATDRRLGLVARSRRGSRGAAGQLCRPPPREHRTCGAGCPHSPRTTGNNPPPRVLYRRLERTSRAGSRDRMLAIASIRTRASGSPALADHHTHKPREGQRSVVRSEERRPRVHRRVVRVADSSRWRAGTDRRCRSVRRRVVHVDIDMTTVRRSVLTMHLFEVCQARTWRAALVARAGRVGGQPW